MKRFFDKGADANAQDGDQVPLLMWAAFGGNLDVFQYLVEKGADPGIKERLYMKNVSYGSVLAAAAGENHMSIVMYWNTGLRDLP